MKRQASHWNAHALQWNLIGSPLRPDRDDIVTLEKEAERWHASERVAKPQAMLLGVTPEIASMRWPAHTRLVSMEHSLAMIRSVWPGARLGHSAVCAEWLALPVPDASQDIVVGDGCYNMLGNTQYRAMTREVRRIIRPHGIFIMRFFIRPDKSESVSRVADDLMRKRIGNFHIFKWRLAMALHASLDAGVKLADIWDAWNSLVPAPGELAAKLGWPLAVLDTVRAYRGVDTRYTFPTMMEAREALLNAFSEIDCHVPHYEMGDRCPTIVFQPR